MTVHVIDLSRPLPPAYEDYKDAFHLDFGDTLILNEGAEIAAYGYGAYGVSGDLWNTVIINGRVHSEQGIGIYTQGVVTIGATGSVRGGREGIYLIYDGLSYSPNILTNAGKISAEMDAVVIQGNQGIVFNSGEITGYSGIFFWDISGWNEKLIVSNTGLIQGTSGLAIYGVWEGTNSITNSGRIEGDIDLGYYDDVYDGSGGTLTGHVYLKSGDDVARGGKGSETFWLGTGTDFADGGEGIDTLGYEIAATVDLRITERQVTGVESEAIIRGIENLIGSAYEDKFTGTDGANMFVGNDGNDTLDGQGGSDMLNGGAGNDKIIGGAGTDVVVFSGKFSDYVISTANGVVTITDKRASGDGTDVISEVELAMFSDTLFTLPTSTPTTPVPAVKNLSFRGGSKADTFVGDKGHDYLNGGLGNDKLTGGEGQDVFAFTSKLGKTNVDWVRDFKSADDTFRLSKAVFGNLPKGWLAKSAFEIGSKADDARDRIIYNDKTGDLFFDRDGNGARYAAVKFGHVEKGTVLRADDFLIV